MSESKVYVLDMWKNKSIIINVMQNDSGRIIPFALKANGAAIDLTGYSAKWYINKSDGTQIYNDCVITDAPSGLLEVHLTEQSLVVTGNAQMVIQTVGVDGAETSFAVNLYIQENIIDGSGIQSSSEFNALITALNTVSQYDNRIATTETEIQNARGGQDNLDARLDGVDSTLADNMHQTDEPIYMKTNSAYINFLNKPILLSSLVVQNLAKTVTYTKDIDYSATENGIKPLSGSIALNDTVYCSYDYSKYVKSSIEDNVEEEKNKPLAIQKTIKKLICGETVNIVFLGDSTTQQIDSMVSGLKNHVGLIADELAIKYPNATINIYNKGVQGNTIKDMFGRLDNDVLDLNPDLVIICSTINDYGSGVTVDDFLLYYETMVQCILSKGSDVILRTSNGVTDNLDSISFSPYDLVAKKLAIKYNLGFLDFSSIWKSLLINGFSRVNDLTYDGTHPNARIHIMLKDEFMKFFDDNFINSINVKKNDNKCKIILANNSNVVNVSPTISTAVTYFEDVIVYSSYSDYNKGSQHYLFYGTEVRGVFARNTDNGNIDVYIDGVKVNTIDLYYNVSIYKCPVILATGLTEGLHTLDIVANGIKNASSTGYGFRLSGIVANMYRDDMPIVFNKLDSYNAIKYGTWTENLAYAGAFNTYTVSSDTATYGHTLNINFKGTFLRIFGALSTGGGQFNLKIDDVDYGTIDLYNIQVVTQDWTFSIGGLKDCEHKLVITTLSTKNASSNSYMTRLEAVQCKEIINKDIISAIVPAIPYEGMKYYDTASHVNKTWNGSSWI